MIDFAVYRTDGPDLHLLGRYRAADANAALVEACSLRPALHFCELVPLPADSLKVQRRGQEGLAPLFSS